MACQSPVPTCCRAPLGTRPRDGTGTLVPHHPHSTSCPGSRCAGMGMGFLDVSPCIMTRLLQAAASSSQRYVPPEMHRVCSRSPCSRYPSPRLARRVRDIGVGAGVGQWTQLEVDGVKELGAAGGEVRVIAARPDGRLRQMAPQNDGSTSCPRECRHPPQPAASRTARRLLRGTTVGTSVWAGLADRSVRRNGRWRGMSTVFSKRLGLCGATCL